MNPSPDSSLIRYRSLNRDGSDNIDRSEMVRGLDDLYHILLSLKWRHFFLWTVAGYIFLNLIFGFAYFSLGRSAISGSTVSSELDFLTSCFFFSVQTFSTIGYGVMSPIGVPANILVAAEAFTGMLSIAVMSGLLFARFSRPTAKIRFSDVALVNFHRGKLALIFRMANARLNQVAEAEVSVILMRNEVTPEGQSMRVQYDLPLMRKRSQFFAASWVVAHVIDENSSLYGQNQKSLMESNSEIFVSVTGFDETFSQIIHARFSYLYDEILWQRDFADMVSRRNGKIFVDLNKISELAPTPKLD